jgi:Zn-dependent protease
MVSPRTFWGMTRRGDSDGSASIPARHSASGALAVPVRPKPVPVNFRALRSPRRDMVLVAAAGPAMNIALAVVAALLFHLVGYLPTTLAPWVTENLKNGLIINVVLAVFNLFPIPPLDGGRILVGVLPKAMAAPVVRLEPFGIAILLGVLIVLPLLGAQLGVDLNIVSRVIRVLTGAILDVILRLTGNA